MSTIATAEVVLVLRSLGVTAELTDDPDAIGLGDGERVRVLERPTPSLAGIQALVAQHTWTCLLVTNEARRAYRQVLPAAGWGWLDRRGRLDRPAAGISQPIDEVLGPAPQTADLWRRSRATPVLIATAGVRRCHHLLEDFRPSFVRGSPVAAPRTSRRQRAADNCTFGPATTTTVARYGADPCRS